MSEPRLRKPPPPADTDLIRLVWFSFGAKQDDLEDCGLTVDGDVTVQCSLVPNDPNPEPRYLALALVPLRYFPDITADKKVVVPDRERKRAESALETMADLLSVARRTSVRISAVGSGSVFLRPRSAAAQRWLDNADDFNHAPTLGGSMEAWNPIDLSHFPVDDLDDRMDGLSLLAESLGAGSSTGEFHELVRFFERAFGSPYQQCDGLVVATADPRLNYTTTETYTWFRQIRDGVSHADSRNCVLLTADTAPYVPRMRQAAYDILFNKKEWRTPDTARRDCWLLRAGSMGEGSTPDVFISRSHAGSVRTAIYDEFGVYPMHVGAGGSFKTGALNPDWWPRLAQVERPPFRASGTLQVIDPPQPVSGEVPPASDT